MASFRAVCLLLVALALCQGAVAATPTEQIRMKFGEITDLSKELRGKCEKIDDFLGVSILNAPELASGFSLIVSKVVAAIPMITTVQPLGDPDAQTVVIALTTFVRVHQELLGVLIGKKGLLSYFPFASPIREALVQLEKAVDAFALVLIDAIPTQEKAAKDQFKSLSGTVDEAKNTY